MADPLKPDATLLCKVGSIIVHVDELLSPGGHEYDRIALGTLLNDQDIRDWLDQMDAMGMVPRKRSHS